MSQGEDDLRERQKDFIRARVKKAELDEKEGGQHSPGVIFAWQQQGKYTFDDVLDNSRDKLSGRTSLPVQERVIMPNGELVTILCDAALEAVRDKMFCGKCEERQPESEVARRASYKSLVRDCGLVLPNRGKDHCPYCGAILGIDGDSPFNDTALAEDQAQILGLNGWPGDSF